MKESVGIKLLLTQSYINKNVKMLVAFMKKLVIKAGGQQWT